MQTPVPKLPGAQGGTACNNFKPNWRNKTSCATCNLDKKLHPNSDASDAKAPEPQAKPAQPPGVRMLPAEPLQSNKAAVASSQNPGNSSPRGGPITGSGSGIMRAQRIEKDKDRHAAPSANAPNPTQTATSPSIGSNAPSRPTPAPPSTAGRPLPQAGGPGPGGRSAPPATPQPAVPAAGGGGSPQPQQPPPPSAPTPTSPTGGQTRPMPSAPRVAGGPTFGSRGPAAPSTNTAAPSSNTTTVTETPAEVIPVPPKPTVHRQTPAHGSGNTAAKLAAPSQGQRPQSIGTGATKLPSPKSSGARGSTGISKQQQSQPMEVSLIRMRSATDPHAMKMTTCGRALNSLLTAIGYSDYTIREIETVTSKAEYGLTKDTGPISSSSQAHLEDIVNSLQNYLRLQQELRNVIKAQAFIRRYQAIKLYRRYRAEYIESSLKKRNETFRGLVRAEIDYVNFLRVVVKKYLEPLRDDKKYRNLCTEKDMSLIFSNVEKLLTVHEEMLHQLQNVQNKWPEVNGLGDIFLTMAPFFRAYGEYVDNFSTGVQTLVALSEKEKRFDAFLNEVYEQCQRESVYVDLHGLLSSPLNHITRSYENAIMNLIDSTPNDHSDHTALMHCFPIISGTSRFIQDSIQYGDNRKILLGVQDKLNLAKEKFGLVADDLRRQFKGEAPCIILSDTTKKATKEKGVLFIFNDIVFITTAVKSVYKVIDKLDVDQLQLEDIPTTSEAPHNAIRLNQPGIGGNPARSYFIGFKEDKDKYVSILRECIAVYASNKVFGMPLIKVLGTDGSRQVPHIVEKLVKCLDQPKVLETEGIFRVSGVLVNVQFLKDSFDKAGINKDPDVNLAALSTHDITSALKLYFRELPEPLMTWALYEPFGTLGGRDSSSPTFLNELRELLRTLPPPNRKVLLYLLRFLAKVATYEDKTKMTPANLAIVFAPTLCSPKQDTIEYALQIGKVNAVVDVMIRNVENLGL